MKQINNYKELLVWQKSIELVKDIYLLTQAFPKEEIYGLTSQMRRSAVSIPSNIAEGRLRNSEKEFKQFLYTAFASGGELETQMVIAKSLPHINKLNFEKTELLLAEVMRMLNGLISRINKSNEASRLDASSLGAR